MRRSVLAVALLLATAPLANATEAKPEVKPEMRAVTVASPSVREDVVVAPARAEARNREAAKVQNFSVGNIIIIALVVIGVLAVVSLI